MDYIGPCQVCGKPAMGIRYAVKACGGCGAFYKRALRRKIKYHCYFGGKCSTDDKRPYRCKACRFRKCASLGMTVSGRERDKSKKPSVSEKKDEIWICPDETSTESDLRTPSPEETSTGDANSVVPFNTTVKFRIMDSLDDSHEKIVWTLDAVENAIQAVFTDQLASLKACRDRALSCTLDTDQPESGLTQMLLVLEDHNCDHIGRVLNFISRLPGLSDLYPSTQDITGAGWKFLVFFMIHHAPFLTTDSDTYQAVGCQQFRLCRYWQHIMLDWPVNRFVFNFCAELQEIGLEQTELYLLAAVIMFEPVENNEDSQLRTLHRHYANVLLDLIRRRCSDAQLTATSHKLSHLLGALKIAHAMYQQHYDDTSFRKNVQAVCWSSKEAYA